MRDIVKDDGHITGSQICFGNIPNQGHFLESFRLHWDHLIGFRVTKPAIWDNAAAESWGSGGAQSPSSFSLARCDLSRLGGQFLREPICPRLVALGVGIGTGRDAFLDPGLDPPQEALAHGCPPIYGE